MPVSLYLESDPGIICSFTGEKADAFIWLAVLILFRGQFVDRALRGASWNRKIQKIGILLTVAGTGILGRGILPESASDSAVREMNFIR